MLFTCKKKQISKSTKILFEKKSQKNHNGYELDEVFGIEYNDSFINKALYLIYRIVDYKKFSALTTPIVRILNLFGIEVIGENDDYNFKNRYLQPSRGIKFYVGGWHSEKYFINIKDNIFKTFQFDINKIGKENGEMLQKIKSSTSVSVHVRRGDFLDPNNYNKFGGVCTLNYFLQAIEKMNSLVKNPHFFFFTNDIPWVKNNFKENNFTIVEINTAQNSWKDMFLMSNCLHNINSNGSFSWWSAWLNKNENKIVIVPQNFMVNKYFEDIYPENWIQLSGY